jgi:hypothetical protein
MTAEKLMRKTQQRMNKRPARMLEAVTFIVALFPGFVFHTKRQEQRSHFGNGISTFCQVP